jgi:DNA-binding LytR/AlgR family response regulator
MVWLVSGFFFNHTFGFGQTFQFAITHHFFKVFLLYTIPIGLYAFFQKRLIFFQKVNASKSTESTETMTSLSVKEGSKQFYIPVKEVLYFSANPPYVDVYHKGKKHLFNITLKSLLEKLDSGIFVRIHKSEIVNLSHVESYKSRQNGDYDVTMIDGTVLRMSRNFAKDFKAKLEILTQDKI